MMTCHSKHIKPIAVLSNFDGMSCGQIALQKAGIPVKQYFATEIDSFAITVTMANFPGTIQLGNIVDVHEPVAPGIDLMIGGSPCQSFSLSGKRNGMSTKCNVEVTTYKKYLQLKSKGFEFEGESFLFWEFYRMWLLHKPKYFLLENVIMSKKWENIITQALGVRPIKINSSLVSAQNRKRLYWTNICSGNIPQPADKNIFLNDILQKRWHKKYVLNSKRLSSKGYDEIIYRDSSILVPTVTKDGFCELFEGECFNATFLRSKTRRGRKMTGKSQTVMSRNSDFMQYTKGKIRQFTPVEIERLQTVPENYTRHVSDTQRYLMLGNGWNVDTIVHFFNHLKTELCKKTK